MWSVFSAQGLHQQYRAGSCLPCWEAVAQLAWGGHCQLSGDPCSAGSWQCGCAAGGGGERCSSPCELPGACKRAKWAALVPQKAVISGIGFHFIFYCTVPKDPQMEIRFLWNTNPVCACSTKTAHSMSWNCTQQVTKGTAEELGGCSFPSLY